MNKIVSLVLFTFWGVSAFAQLGLSNFDFISTDSLIIDFDKDRIASNKTPEYIETAGVKNFNYFIGKQLEIAAFVAIDSLNNPIVSESEVQSVISSFNQSLSKTRLSFRMCEYTLIDDGSYANISQLDTCNTLQLLLKDYYKANTINLYFLESISTSNENNLENYVTMPDAKTTNDFILLTSNDPYTAIHSMGHFLGLYHTHETELWGAEKVIEKQPQCYRVGDLICDTPAQIELNSNGLVDIDCEYSGMKVDEDGIVSNELKDGDNNIYVPSVTNYMSHIPASCAIMFTEEQLYRVSIIYDQFYQYLK